MLEPKEIRLLAEIGFIASNQGNVPHAKAIFEALLLVRPDKAMAYVGQGWALIKAGKFADASSFLAAANLPEGVESDTVEALLGLALQLEGRVCESTRILHAVVDRGSTAGETNDGVRLAQAFLDAASRPHRASVP